MTIDDFINESYIINKQAPEKESNFILKLIREINQKYDIEVVEIFSNYVFLRIISFENKKTLIWDTSYWYIYNNFLLNMCCLDYAQENEDIDLRMKALNDVVMGFLYYLALKLYDDDYPYVACEFANQYNLYKTKYHNNFYIYDASIEIMDEYTEIAKVYCSVHEIMHSIYNRDEERKKEDLISLNGNLDIVEKTYEALSNNEFDAMYHHDKKDFLKVIEKCRNEKRMKEEILCDVQAFNQCFELYSSIWNKKYNVDVIIDKCFESISILNFFNNILMQLDKYWLLLNSLYRGCKTKEEYKIELDELNRQMIMRFYIQEIVSTIQLAKKYNNYPLQMGKNFILNNLSNKKLVENKIYEMLLSVDSVMQIFENVESYLKEDKERIKNLCYQLLGWAL